MKQLVVFVVLAACGGGSGVDGSKKLVELSASEDEQVCSHALDVFPSRVVDCGQVKRGIGIKSVDDCVAKKPVDAACAATVADFEACIDAEADLSDNDWCTQDSFPSECAAVVNPACAGAGPG